MTSSPLCKALFKSVWAIVPVIAINKIIINWFKLGMVRYGYAATNVEGIIPTPAYKEIVTAESVSVNLLINIRDIDQIKAEVSINKPPKLIEMSGLRTTIVPKKPTNKAIILLIFNFSFKNTKARNVVKIGTVKFSAVTSESVVIVRP